MVRGSCLCGGVRFEADKIEIITNCHCSMCRKAQGAAFGSFASAYRDKLRFTAGEDLVASYQSSPENQRGFCRVCGSSLPKPSASQDTVVIPAGALDDDPGVKPCLHMFTGSKAPWHEIEDELPAFEEWVPGHGPDDPA